jgi:hypothetical protein
MISEQAITGGSVSAAEELDISEEPPELDGVAPPELSGVVAPELPGSPVPEEPGTAAEESTGVSSGSFGLFESSEQAAIIAIAVKAAPVIKNFLICIGLSSSYHLPNLYFSFKNCQPA